MCGRRCKGNYLRWGCDRIRLGWWRGWVRLETRGTRERWQGRLGSCGWNWGAAVLAMSAGVDCGTQRVGTGRPRQSRGGGGAGWRRCRRRARPIPGAVSRLNGPARGVTDGPGAAAAAPAGAGGAEAAAMPAAGGVAAVTLWAGSQGRQRAGAATVTDRKSVV